MLLAEVGDLDLALHLLFVSVQIALDIISLVMEQCVRSVSTRNFLLKFFALEFGSNFKTHIRNFPRSQTPMIKSETQTDREVSDTSGPHCFELTPQDILLSFICDLTSSCQTKIDSRCNMIKILFWCTNSTDSIFF